MVADDAGEWHFFLDGSPQAFEQIYHRHIDYLYDYGMRLCQDSSLVEDCLQEMFSHLWEKKEKLPEVSSVRAYLLVALKRRVLRELNNQQKQTHKPVSEITYYLQDFDPHIGDDLSADWVVQLQNAFVKLSDKQKEVIYLRFYNQLTFGEIAEVLDISIKAVYKLMARAIQALRTQVDPLVLPTTLVIILLLKSLFA